MPANKLPITQTIRYAGKILTHVCSKSDNPPGSPTTRNQREHLRIKELKPRSIFNMCAISLICLEICATFLLHNVAQISKQISDIAHMLKIDRGYMKNENVTKMFYFTCKHGPSSTCVRFCWRIFARFVQLIYYRAMHVVTGRHCCCKSSVRRSDSPSVCPSVTSYIRWVTSKVITRFIIQGPSLFGVPTTASSMPDKKAVLSQGNRAMPQLFFSV